jgi:methyltransferase family protein
LVASVTASLLEIDAKSRVRTVASCCDPNGLNRVFDAGRADADARSYRRKGLGREARTIVDFLATHGMAGGTVLEIGGGVGAIQIELLRSGARRATSVELSVAYQQTSRELAAELGVADRIELRLADFAREAPRIDPADAVVLNKVVCCYPDMPGLVRPAAEHARRWLALTFPADRWWIRSGMRLAGFVMALFRSRFRLFFHEPAAIVEVARGAGLRPAFSRRGIFWHVQVLERA